MSERTRNTRTLQVKELMDGNQCIARLAWHERLILPSVRKPKFVLRRSLGLKAVSEEALYILAKHAARPLSAIVLHGERPQREIDRALFVRSCLTLVACFLLCAVKIGFSQQSSANRVTPPDTMQQFQKLEDRWREAIVNRDQYTLELALAPEMIDISASGEVTTRNQQIALLLHKSASPTSLSMIVANVRTYGDAAVVIGTYAERVHLNNNQQIERKGLFTHFYQRVRGNWQCMSAQRTLLAEPALQKMRGASKEHGGEPPFPLRQFGDDGSSSSSAPPPPKN